MIPLFNCAWVNHSALPRRSRNPCVACGELMTYHLGFGHALANRDSHPVPKVKERFAAYFLRSDRKRVDGISSTPIPQCLDCYSQILSRIIVPQHPGLNGLYLDRLHGRLLLLLRSPTLWSSISFIRSPTLYRIRPPTLLNGNRLFRTRSLHRVAGAMPRILAASFNGKLSGRVPKKTQRIYFSNSWTSFRKTEKPFPSTPPLSSQSYHTNTQSSHLLRRLHSRLLA